jgi:hypothetical protein
MSAIVGGLSYAVTHETEVNSHLSNARRYNGVSGICKPEHKNKISLAEPTRCSEPLTPTGQMHS